MKALIATITTATAALTMTSCSTTQVADCEKRLRQETSDPDRMDFTSNERILVCGDASNAAWSEIPIAQSERTLRVFLSEKGYYSPRFRREGETLVFSTGPRSLVDRIEFIGAPPGFEGERHWIAGDSGLHRRSLDDVEAWSLARLRRIGYACARAEVTAAPSDGVIRVRIQAGELWRFPEPNLADPYELEPMAWRRYDAFRPGDPFDSRLLDLTSSRIQVSGMAVSSAFPFRCEKNGKLRLEHRLIPGETRLVQIGIGATTEEFPIARLLWKNVRLGPHAGTFLGRIYASPLHQLAEVGFEAYPFRNALRTALEPKIAFERWNERDLKGFEVRVPLRLAQSWEYEFARFRAEGGPAGVYRKIDEGRRPGTGYDLVYELVLDWLDHEQEIYTQDPRDGFRGRLTTQTLASALGSTTDASSIAFEGSYLWNFSDLDPPKWVLGTRWGLSTVLTRGGDGSDPKLPDTMKVTLGGDADLRGFGRRELPGEGRLALTGIYWGTELRRANWLPARIEPYLFFDLGWLGARTFSLDPRLFYSPGLGVRWQSPFGTIRGSLAHGWISGTEPPAGREELEHFQMFLSFGKEF